MDSIWDDDSDIPDSAMAGREWNKMQQAFSNHGYREGLAEGKENGKALQEGFDVGFAEVGVPLGTQMGTLRGLANASLAYLQRPSFIKPATTDVPGTISRLKEIIKSLNEVQLKDLAPPDREAYEHAAYRAHALEEEGTDDRERDPKTAREEKEDLDKTLKGLIEKREKSLKDLDGTRQKLMEIVKGMGIAVD